MQLSLTIPKSPRTPDIDYGLGICVIISCAHRLVHLRRELEGPEGAIAYVLGEMSLLIQIAGEVLLSPTQKRTLRLFWALVHDLSRAQWGVELLLQCDIASILKNLK